MIFDHFIDFGHFPIEIPTEAEKKYPHGKERSQSKNKNSSETSEPSGLGNLGNMQNNGF